jgi:glycosyltransferase involved in cell wall biosynthesis
LCEIGVPRERISTVENGIDSKRIILAAVEAPATPLPSCVEAPVVLVPTASIRRVKGIHLVLQAVGDIPGLQVWVTGDMGDSAAGGYANELLELSNSRELRGRVHFIGFRQDIYSVMRKADIVCVPSVCREGFGLVAAEAMILGRPVIVSNKGALPDIVQQGRAGSIFSLERPQELTAAIRKLVSDLVYVRRVVAYAASYAETRFSYSRWAQEIGAVLRDIQA